jgi:hypothetical protein
MSSNSRTENPSIESYGETGVKSRHSTLPKSICARLDITHMRHKRYGRIAMVGFFCVLLHTDVSAETITDSALWTGGLFLWEREKNLHYSAEYQVRLDENMTALSSHFLELMTYKKAGESLLFNAGYRYTLRPDHDEHRLYVGGFWDMTRNAHSGVDDGERLRVVLQLGYQHDFNAKFDDRLMGSNSIRWILVASRQATEYIRPFLLAGVLTTWNDANSFGADKIRLGGGMAVTISNRSRLRAQYMFERSFFRSPLENTNIFWLRYEANFGIP